MSLESRVIDEIDRLKPDLIKQIQEMVRIPSENPPGDEVQVSEYLASALESLGFKVQLVESKPKRVNTLGVIEGTGKGGNLLWNGHMDTVPVGNLDNWTVEPFSGEVKEGRVYGRGSGDMKGAIVSAMIAAKALGNTGIELGGDLHLHGVADEEFFGRYGTKYLCEKGYVKGIDAAIVGEASTREGRVMARPAVRGRTLLKLHVKGISAHSSRPEHGVNAVLKMSKLLIAVNETEFSFPSHGLLPDPTIAPGTTIKGGTKDNIIPEDCEAICDVRTVPGMSPDKVLQDVEAILKKLHAEDPEMQATVTSPLSKPPSEIPITHSLYQSAADATQRVMGYKLEPLGASGSNDTSYLTNIAKIPAMAFGPGGGNAHAPDEWTDIETQLNFSKIYALMMMDICGVKQ
ncbi:MAG: M20 family metallopeptidase [Candidatus Bathyarchaeota archaeon]|nr:M20 family metallopeptidase [Candidatus Bathyarchaeota archaeon]